MYDRAAWAADDLDPGRVTATALVQRAEAATSSAPPQLAAARGWPSSVAEVDERAARAHGLVSFDPGLRVAGETPVQRRDDGAAPLDDAHVHRLADAGFAGGGSALPHLDAIQRSFGRHDVTGVVAHVGGAAEQAARGMGASAYASGNRVAFASAPDLHLAAHEAAHVVQQRGGVSLKGGVGAAGDAYEQHADAVADRVVRGVSAEALLDMYSGGGAASRATVQHRTELRERTRRREVTVPAELAALRAEAIRWLGGEVSRATAPELVDGSNLAELYRGLVDNGRVGERVTLAVRLIPAGARYGRAEFSTPGQVSLEEVTIEGSPDGAADSDAAGHTPESRTDDGTASTAEQDQTLGNAVVQQPDQECEAGEPGDLSAHHFDLIRAFARRAHELIAPWAQQRNSENLRFDDSAMRAHYQQFTTSWLRDIAAQEGDTDRPIAFENNPAARAEARRLLDTGTFRQSVREIRAFNFSALGSYSELLGLGRQDLIQHRYRLEVVSGVQAGAGEGLNGEAIVRRYEIFYDNEMGMHWTGHGNGFLAGAGPGVGTSPVAANVDLGGTYEGSSSFYFSAEDFDLSTVYYIAASGQAADQSVGAEQLVFRNNGRELRVSSTQLGGGDRWGTDNAGTVGVMTGAGTMDVTRVDRPTERLPDMESREQQPPTEGEWTPLISMAVLFRTQEDQLDGDDRGTIEDLVARMRSYEERHPGSIFKIVSQGRASRRWRGAGSEDEAYELNVALAQRRCGVVQQALAQRLVELRTEFQSGVIESSQSLSAAPGGQTGESPDDDRQVDRSVLVAVYYNACGPDGRVGGGMRL